MVQIILSATDNFAVSCSEMSASSTPHRHSRGMSPLSIDTKEPILSGDSKESVSKTATALQCAGWLTPPQSAHESRRPSLAWLSYSEMPYSVVSTGPTFSLPSTPSRSMPENARHAVPSYSDEHIKLDLNTPLIGNQISNNQLSQDMVHLNLEGQANCDMGQQASWSGHPTIPSVPDHYGSYLGAEHSEPVWHDQQAHDESFLQHPAGLQTTLFPICHGLPAGHHINPHPQIYDSTACSLADNVATGSGFPYHSTQTTCTQSPTIIEPLLVQWYPESNHWSTNGSISSSPQEMSTSFDSSMASSWEELRTPSPEVDRCTKTDGYVLICEEDHNTSPASTPTSRPSRTRLRSRRSAKRSRKTPRAQERIIRGNGVTITLESESIAFENDQLVRIGQSSSSKKPFLCGQFKGDGTICRAAFQRSEHLKRHMGSHSTDRPYPCVLPDCVKKIGRSDNACDHFRTHLQPHKANKRNKHFHWREAELRIRHGYDEKKASKILANLQRWLQNKIATDPELRQAHDDDAYVPFNAPLYREEDLVQDDTPMGRDEDYEGEEIL